MDKKQLSGIIAAGTGTAAAGIGTYLYLKKKGAETPKTYGLICPMEEEMAPFLEAMAVETTIRLSGLTFYEGSLDGARIILVQCGVGKVNAALCTEALCTRFTVDCIINIGVAGTTHQGVKQGDIVIATEAVQHDMDVTCRGFAPGEVPDMGGMTYVQASAPLVAAAKEAAGDCLPDGVAVFTGRVASGDQFISDRAVAEGIDTKFGAYAVEMEGAAIAQVAWVNHVPFAIIRAITDNADEDAPALSYPEFLPTAIENSFAVVRRMLRLDQREPLMEA